MRISCPNCEAAYDVPETALASGPRRLRCAKCGHQFQAALPGTAPSRAEPPPVPVATVEPAQPAVSIPNPPPPRLAEKLATEKPPRPEPAPTLPPMPHNRAQGRLRDAPSSPPDRFALAGWLLTIAVLGVAGYAAYAFRVEIVTAWPPALRVYALLGLG